MISKDVSNYSIGEAPFSPCVHHSNLRLFSFVYVDNMSLVAGPSIRPWPDVLMLVIREISGGERDKARKGGSIAEAVYPSTRAVLANFEAGEGVSYAVAD